MICLRGYRLTRWLPCETLLVHMYKLTTVLLISFKLYIYILILERILIIQVVQLKKSGYALNANRYYVFFSCVESIYRKLNKYLATEDFELILFSLTESAVHQV